MKNIVTTCMVISAASFFSIGCRKADNKNTVTAPPPTAVAVDSGKITLHMHTYIGDNEVDGYNIAYTTDDGRKISLGTAQFYISDIQLVKPDGSTYPVSGKIVLKTLEEESYAIGSVPAGSYKAVKFRVGLDDATNSKEPSAIDVLNHPEMWFGNTAQPDGYVFLNMQGKIDTTAGASGTAAQMQPFSYKIGTSAHYVQVALPDHAPVFTLTKGGTEFIHMVFDYGVLFSGLKLNDPSNLMVNTKAANNAAISNAIANNIPGAVRYEE